MIPTMLAALGGQGALYLALAAVLLLALLVAGMVVYRAGHNAATVAQDRVTAKADAAKVAAEANAWKAAIGIPADPTVVLKDHRV